MALGTRNGKTPIGQVVIPQKSLHQPYAARGKSTMSVESAIYLKGLCDVTRSMGNQAIVSDATYRGL
jgi:hypothetical protein